VLVWGLSWPVRCSTSSVSAGDGCADRGTTCTFAADIVLSKRPAVADGAVGTWRSADGEVTISISPRNTAKFSHLPDIGTGRGAVRWEADGTGFLLGWPIVGYKKVEVARWPSSEAAEDTLEANGVILHRV
jgi:hypothetical protein